MKLSQRAESYYRPAMASGASLLVRLWDTHPRLAFVVHLLVCLLIVAGLFVVLRAKVWAAVVILAASLALGLATLAWCTRDAARTSWSRSNDS